MSRAHDADGSASPPYTVTASDVLRYPSGTALRFVLLISMLILSGVFIGYWLYLSASRPSAPGAAAPWPWLLGTPAAIFVLATLLVLAFPRWKERREALVPFPEGQSATAVARYRELAGEAGLRHRPVIMWNPRNPTVGALAYGNPGHYRVAVAPAVFGAAHRHPSAFEMIIRHELAHIRNKDVLVSYFAVSSWYALLPALAAPLVLRLTDRDFSLVGDYSVRAVALALAFYMVRAGLLRSREYYADTRAASWAHDGGAVSAVLATASPQRPPHKIAQWFALHPSGLQRGRTLRDPSLLGHPHAAELLAASFTAGATLRLLRDLIASMPGITVVNAGYIARSALFALLGAYAGAVVVRAEATGHLTDRIVGFLAGMVVIGLGSGQFLSLGETGLLKDAPHDLAGNVIASLLCGALIVVGCDIARLHGRSRGHRSGQGRAAAGSLLYAGAFALAANAALTISVVVREHSIRFLWSQHLPFILTNGGWATALAALLAAVASARLITARRSGTRIPTALATGCALGITAALCAVAIRWHNGTFTSDDAAWRYYLTSLWLIATGASVAAVAATLASSARAATGVVTGAAAIVVGCIAFVLLNKPFGSSLGPAEAITTMRLTAGIATMTALPLSALTSLIAGGSRQHDIRRHHSLHGLRPHQEVDLGGPRPANTAGGAAAPASACSGSAPEIQPRRAGCPPLGLIIAATADAEPLQSPPDNLGRHRHWPGDTAA